MLKGDLSIKSLLSKESQYGLIWKGTYLTSENAVVNVAVKMLVITSGD